MMIAPTVIAIYYCVALGCFAIFFLIPDYFHHLGLVQHGKTVMVSSATSTLAQWQISKRWFSAFYFIGLISSILWLRKDLVPNWILILHLIRRSIETIVWPYSTTSTMHLIHGLVGITYYPVMVASLEIAQNSFLIKWGPFFAFLCISIMLIQSYCHSILFMARKRGKYLPRSELGWLFRSSPTPHYICEVLFYGILMLWSRLHVFMTLNFLFVYSNLYISSLYISHWYRNQ